MKLDMTPPEPENLDELELLHEMVDAGQIDKPEEGFVRAPTGQELKDLIDQFKADAGLDENGRPQ